MCSRFGMSPKARRSWMPRTGRSCEAHASSTRSEVTASRRSSSAKIARSAATESPITSAAPRPGASVGYFLFGGSTVIVLGEPGRWQPEPELVTQTANRRETLTRLGAPVGPVV
jgi:hypothetical protein